MPSLAFATLRPREPCLMRTDALGGEREGSTGDG